jgi:GT2 family glycosyltransferase
MQDTQVLILNWNGGKDTAACIQSLFAIEDANITVLDNGSADNSVEEIRSTARAHNILLSEFSLDDFTSVTEVGAKITLIHSKENLGFAKGINSLLKQLGNRDGLKYAWLLNNDAAADGNTLKYLKQKIEEREENAFAGSVILDYYDREVVQCCGVDYYKWFGVAKLILKGERWTSAQSQLQRIAPVFQHGASLLVKLTALSGIGYMDEQFFLYAEEHDWQKRAEKKNFKNVLAPESIVYHKGSMSTLEKKQLFYYHYNTSAIYFSRKHYDLLVNISATVMLCLITVVRARFQPRSVAWGMKGIICGWQKALDK